MLDRSTRQFLRWRDHGDVDALAVVFDRTAPELLRLASHLAGDLGDSEDLVQGTFLAAIEAANRFERQRKVVPWLVGILTHLAQAERRRRQRAPVPGAVTDAVVAPNCEPAENLAATEQCDAARAALEGLREPFRQPTLLRVVHGMEPTEIAVLLNRSPTTVRSQIHRGIEQARRTLPTGIATGLFIATATAGRGLAAIRTQVLAAGVRAAATKAVIGTAATSGITIAGVVMSKQGVSLVAVLLGCVAVLGVSLWPYTANGPDAYSPPRDAGSATAVTANASGETSRSMATTDEPANRVAAPVSIAGAAWLLHARVLDGPTGKPIADAPVDLFGPRLITLIELQRQFAIGATLGPTGIPIMFHDSVRIPRELPLEVTLNGARYPFIVPPAAGDIAITQLVTDTDGRCVLPMPATGSVLRVGIEGYGQRQLAFEETIEDELEIRLWPNRKLVGFVRTDRDEVPPVTLRLQLEGDGSKWSAHTDATGRFETTIAARRVQVSCRTHGWTVTRNYARANGAKRITLKSLSADEQGTIYVTRFDGARLHVTDAKTKAPIETIALRSFDNRKSPRHCGTFAAPDGWLTVAPFTPSDILQTHAEQRGGFPARLSITVWAEGYAPTTVLGIDLYGEDPPVVEVQLEPGQLESFTGHVVRNGAAIEGARVQLRPYSALNWQSSRECVLAASVTAGDGAFAMAAPAGSYLCEVFVEGSCQAQFEVVLPGDGQRIIDLAAAVHVEVVVVDANGRPQADHNVSITGANHQQHQGRTSADGHVTFGPFVAGRLSVMAARKPTDHSWTSAVSDEVEAVDGSRPVVTLRLPPEEWVRPVLVFEGTAPPSGFTGFLARELESSNEPKEVAVAPDGSVPLDLRPDGGRVRIRAPNGRRWSLELPEGARQGHVFALRWTGLALAGVATIEGGVPLANARVFAEPVGAGGTTASVLTDDEGRFRLDGLESRPYTLGFHQKATSNYRTSRNNPYSMQRFRPDALPTAQPAPIQIRLTRFANSKFEGRDEITVTGRAVSGSKSPIEGVIVSFMTLLPQKGGTLELFPVSGWQQTTADGSYRITLARGDRYRTSIIRRIGKQPRTEVITLPQGSEVTRDFVLQ